MHFVILCDTAVAIRTATACAPDFEPATVAALVRAQTLHSAGEVCQEVFASRHYPLQLAEELDISCMHWRSPLVKLRLYAGWQRRVWCAHGGADSRSSRTHR
eukprot:CAMPEP_0195053338 /NCGR_PEP_ID=MMETSP0448-20130528/2508_1 /TAXON_ID=66468 /ORGANISM="Heterocapsa triquestra, Strain CCMP 448" /LENGTH=101 /DNA_ID=CAMNT_0040082617 /DNA_START=84 /DNA_END=389 /DNA_ORIENTATION=-